MFCSNVAQLPFIIQVFLVIKRSDLYTNVESTACLFKGWWWELSNQFPNLKPILHEELTQCLNDEGSKHL
jgi:hypothetical protein